MKASLLIIVVLSISACSSQNVYDSLRFHQELDCQNRLGADRDDCMRRAGMSYDEYQRQLKQREQENTGRSN